MTRELLEAINIQAKREGFFWPVLRAIIFEQLAQKYPAKHLYQILSDHRGGNWGADQRAELLPAPSLRSPDIRHGSIDLSQAEIRFYTPSELEKHCLINGDILVIKSNGSLDLVGKSQLFLAGSDSHPVTASNFLLILSPDITQVDPTYLDWFLKSPQALVWRVDKQRTTTGLRNLDTDGYLATSVPLPPSRETQEEIVEILTAINNGDWPNNSHFDIRLAERAKAVSDAFENLESESAHQQSLLAKLKQAILQEAIEGKLTADWRAAHPDVEPACQLLHRIQAEKARLIAAKKLRPEKPLPKINPEEIPFKIPKGWEWCRLGSIARHSLGKMLDHGKNKGTPKPYLRNLNVQWFRLVLSDVKEMRFEDREIEKYSVEKGDIVICEGGYPGQAAIWEHDEPIMFQKALHRVRFLTQCYAPILFVQYLKFADEAGFLKNYFTGSGIKHFTGDALHSFVLPFPPLAEQAAIVARVEALMASCRALETEIEHSRTHAAHLLQAVLKEAFAPASE